MSENKTPKTYRRPVKVAITVLIAGFAVSLAGNLAAINLDDGKPPGVGAYISAVWWPLALFLMVELTLHTPWDSSFRDKAVRYLGITLVGGLAFYISYFHLAHVLSSFGYDTPSRYAGPLAVDVAMVVATMALNRIGVATRAAAATASGQEGRTTPPPIEAPGVPEATDRREGDDLGEDGLNADWSGLDAELDAELAEMVATAQAEPVAETPPPSLPLPPSVPSATVQLTAVPEQAAKLIRETLEADAAATGAFIARELLSAGLAGSEKTGRRYVAAVKNGTARVS